VPRFSGHKHGGMQRFLLAVLPLVACTSASPKKEVPLTASATLPQAARLLATPAADFTALCEATLSNARAEITALKALPATAGLDVLKAYDAATTKLQNMSARVGLAREVHPEAAFREAAEACEQKLEAFGVELAQDRGVYESLARLDVKSVDAVTAHYLGKTLREFRRAGVDKDDATRAKVKTLNESLVKTGQAFGRNIRDDVRTVKMTAAQVDGLPADWRAAHPAGADGLVAVTTNTPDFLPVMLYAKDTAAREALWRAHRTRAFPANVDVLKELLRLRHELATLLGYRSWAHYATETRMVGDEKAAAEFIAKGESATKRRAEADMAVLLERKRKDVPAATAVEPWEHDFYEDRVKSEQYGLDTQALRPYFEYGRVKQGVMATTAKLFGIRFQPVTDAKVWHPAVETFDIFEGSERLGRIHLDMHPRDNKYKHAAQFGLTTGRAGVELPEAVLVCNFPPAGGLMQHSEVETFFHEFGHLLHEIFAGRQAWGGVSGIKTEWDFVEVPSMLLQEWPLDAEVLKGFATHHQTGEVIPPSLVAQLKRAKEFGVGLSQRRQFFLSAVSFMLHTTPPGFDTTEVLKTQQQRFLPFRREWVEGTHFEMAFGHLDGYSATYYTYQWSTVIAKDLLTQFKQAGMLDAATALKYRREVLDAAGSRPAAASVAAFLGRPYTFEAFEGWLNAK
jgi:thimet oligopeptidase